MPLPHHHHDRRTDHHHRCRDHHHDHPRGDNDIATTISIDDYGNPIHILHAGRNISDNDPRRDDLLRAARDAITADLGDAGPVDLAGLADALTDAIDALNAVRRSVARAEKLAGNPVT